MNILRATILSCLLTSGQLRLSRAQEAQFIAQAQRVLAQSLDSTLPAVPFGQWVRGLRSLPASSRHWEVNDCGEGGDGRVAPTCVEAILDLASDTSAHASLIVAGLDGKSSTPTIFMLYALTRDSTLQFKRLSEWAAYVQRRQR